MDSLHFDIDARVGLGFAAGDAGAGREIGIDVTNCAMRSDVPAPTAATSPPSSWPMTRG